MYDATALGGLLHTGPCLMAAAFGIGGSRFAGGAQHALTWKRFWPTITGSVVACLSLEKLTRRGRTTQVCMTGGAIETMSPGSQLPHPTRLFSSATSLSLPGSPLGALPLTTHSQHKRHPHRRSIYQEGRSGKAVSCQVPRVGALALQTVLVGRVPNCVRALV